MDPEISVGGAGGDDYVFSHQSISQRAIRISFEKQLDQMGPIASQGGPYQYF